MIRFGLDGGLALYSYAKMNPINNYDPDGRKPYTFQWGIGGGVGHYVIGGSIYQLNVSDPIRGKTCRYTVYCGGLGIGLPEAGINSPHMEWDDGEECSNCDKFSGIGAVSFASLTPGVGISFGGWMKVPNGPLLTADGLINPDGGAFRVGTAVSICRFQYEGMY